MVDPWFRAVLSFSALMMSPNFLFMCALLQFLDKAHAKRKFAELVKSVGAETANNSIATEATRMILKLFHLDNQWDDMSQKEQKKQRQLVLKLKVDDFFVWTKTEIQKLPAQSTTRNGLQYCINQE